MRQAAIRLSEEHPQREGLVQRPLVRVCLTCSGHNKDRRPQRSQESNPSRA